MSLFHDKKIDCRQITRLFLKLFQEDSVCQTPSAVVFNGLSKQKRIEKEEETMIQCRVADRRKQTTGKLFRKQVFASVIDIL